MLSGGSLDALRRGSGGSAELSGALQALRGSPGLSGALRSSPELSGALRGSITECSSEHTLAMALAIA
eukprot:7513993-Alexandrium_andersonii.AAC.1